MALEVKAVENGFSVVFFRLDDLLQEMKKGYSSGPATQPLAGLDRSDRHSGR